MNETESNERNETNETGEHGEGQSVAASVRAGAGSPGALAFGGRRARIAPWRLVVITLITFLVAYAVVVVLSASGDWR